MAHVINKQIENKYIKELLVMLSQIWFFFEKKLEVGPNKNLFEHQITVFSSSLCKLTCDLK